MSVIECNNVSIRYITGDFKAIGLKEYVIRHLTGKYKVKEFWADKDVTFRLEKGDMLGIIGSNGAGKSTLLKAITGIMVPTYGELHTKGNIAALLELASGFDGDMTVRENTYLRGALLGYTREFLDEKYDEIIRFAELEDFQEYEFKQLSSGMKSRLAFAIACLVNPDIIILDEVLSVGDGAFRKKSGDKMKEILNSGVTGLLVSHSISQVRELCNKILWLDHGKQIAFTDDVEHYCDAYEEFLMTKKLPKSAADIDKLAEGYKVRKLQEEQEKEAQEIERARKKLEKIEKDSAKKAEAKKKAEDNKKSESDNKATSTKSVKEFEVKIDDYDLILESPDDVFLQEDLEKTANYDKIPFEMLKDSQILVTGATGLVGSQMVKSLAAMNRIKKLNMRILALVRNEKKAKEIYGDLLTRSDIILVNADLNDKEQLVVGVKSALQEDRKFYVIHGAAVTTSKTMIEQPVGTIDTSLRGTESILKLASECNVASFVYLSSMEVYGTWDGSSIVTEDKMGYVDPMAVRSNYPLTKRMCENMCIAYNKQNGVPVKIARLSQTFGAGTLPKENRVFAQFAKSAMHKKDIVLHTKGQSEGNYCYTADTIRALLIILLKGENASAYNISNESTHTTIAGMAKFVAEKLADNKIKVIFDIPEENTFGYAADTKMKLSSKKLQSLGWNPEYDLETAYNRMIGSMRERGID